MFALGRGLRLGFVLVALAHRLEGRLAHLHHAFLAGAAVPPGGLAALEADPAVLVDARRDERAIARPVVLRHREGDRGQRLAAQRLDLAAAGQHIQVVDRLRHGVVTPREARQKAHVRFVRLVDVNDRDRVQLGRHARREAVLGGQLAEDLAERRHGVAGRAAGLEARLVLHLERRRGGHDQQQGREQLGRGARDDELALVDQPRFLVAHAQADLAVDAGQPLEAFDVHRQLEGVRFDAGRVDVLPIDQARVNQRRVGAVDLHRRGVSDGHVPSSVPGCDRRRLGRLAGQLGQADPEAGRQGRAVLGQARVDQPEGLLGLVVGASQLPVKQHVCRVSGDGSNPSH